MKYDCSEEFDLNVIYLKLIGVCAQANAELPDRGVRELDLPTVAEFQRALRALCV